MKYKVISISLDAAAHQELRKRLGKLGMSRSEYVRHLIRKDVVTARKKGGVAA